MPSKKRRSAAKKRRQTSVLLKRSEKKQIREFSKFIPSLDKYKNKDKITSAEYAAFKRAKKKLRNTDNLYPVTDYQAKKLKGKLAGGGIRAVRLRNTSPTAKVRIGPKGMLIVSNGRDWDYIQVKARNAIELPDKLIEKGRQLFYSKTRAPWQLHLWTGSGRLNESASNFESWIQIVTAYFLKYEHSQEYIQGVAALVRDERGYRGNISDDINGMSNKDAKRLIETGEFGDDIEEE